MVHFQYFHWLFVCWRPIFVGGVGLIGTRFSCFDFSRGFRRLDFFISSFRSFCVFSLGCSSVSSFLTLLFTFSLASIFVGGFRRLGSCISSFCFFCVFPLGCGSVSRIFWALFHVFSYVLLGVSVICCLCQVLAEWLLYFPSIVVP